MNPRSVACWPASERPRERLLEHGAAALSDAELVAVLLRTGRPGVPVLDLARSLLAEHGSIGALLAASPAALGARPGVGPAASATFAACMELARRSMREHLQQSPLLGSSRAAADFLTLWLRQRDVEVFAALFLDARNRLVRAEELFRGTLSQTAVYPRELVRRALALNAAAVIVSHNHPPGVAEPSSADELLTRTLWAALSQVDVNLLDHLIVAGNQVYSFAEHGRLPAGGV
jgi:DNA repair protein RadC